MLRPHFQPEFLASIFGETEYSRLQRYCRRPAELDVGLLAGNGHKWRSDPADHHYHKNVILRETAEDKVPVCPIVATVLLRTI
jgi:hypothetical protein